MPRERPGSLSVTSADLIREVNPAATRAGFEIWIVSVSCGDCAETIPALPSARRPGVEPGSELVELLSPRFAAAQGLFTQLKFTTRSQRVA